MKKIMPVFLLLLLALVLCGCGHEHVWSEATCEVAKTCNKCGETEGEPLGHNWEDATCLMPKICSVCRKTEGKALGHKWKDATCTKPKTCVRCKTTKGESLGHDAPALSCTDASTCKRCGKLIPALGHKWKDANCTDPKTCLRCGRTEGKALGHKPSEPVKENKQSASCTEEGSYEEVVYCSVCNKEMSRKLVTVKALGHSTTSGTCSRCGKEIYERMAGYGDDVVENIDVGDGLYRVHFINSGRSNFIVHIYDDYGDSDLAINEIGYFDGYCFLNGTAPYMFEIESSGSWSYQIEKLGTTSETSFSGNGYYVTDMFSGESGSYRITHSGRDNFIVHLYTSDGTDLIVNEIGNYSGTKYISIPYDSRAIFVIQADGRWSISPTN